MAMGGGQPCPGSRRRRREPAGVAGPTGPTARMDLDRAPACPAGRSRRVRNIHPPGWLVAQVLELPRQPLADLARAALDLAPVAGLDLQPLGEAPLQAAQGGGIGLLDGGLHEFITDFIASNQQVAQAIEQDYRFYA